MKLSGELDYRIRYDMEHDLFHAENVFNDEYIKPTFIEYVQKLEKENAELKSLKDVADLIRLNNSHIVAMAQLNNNNVALRKENAELKADNDARKFAMAMSEKVEKQLREENAELKSRECWKSCEYANSKTELIGQHIKDVQQLTNAKEIIRKMLYEYQRLCLIKKETIAEAEQFISEVEK